MDWKVFLGTFALIFLAELGDKTQLSAMAFSASSKSTYSVFFGASLALILSTLIAVALGAALSSQKMIPQSAIKIAAGGLFLVFGGILIFNGLYGEKKSQEHVEIGKPDLLTRLALRAAIDFEKNSSRDFAILAEGLADGPSGEIMRQISEEEKSHAERLNDLGHEIIADEHKAHPEKPEFPQLVLPESASSSDRAFIEKLIEHKRRAAAFYRELADSAILPSIQSAFQAIASEEDEHVKHLVDLIG